MAKTKKNQQPFIFKVSKFSPNRLHIEIPASRKKEFEAGEHVEIRKLSLTTTNRGEAKKASDLPKSINTDCSKGYIRGERGG